MKTHEQGALVFGEALDVVKVIILELFSIKDVVRVASFGKLVSFQVSSDN
jgi:hypothetical protein